MSEFKFTAYPKPWEITVSKVLDLFISPARVIIFFYCLLLFFSPPIAWSQLGILVLISIALTYCQKNVTGILGVVNERNSKSRE